jgi:nucleoside-diphosphate-sugar epimerase
VKILVTGGAGYIGSVVAHQLLGTMIPDAWDWMRTHPNGYR